MHNEHRSNAEAMVNALPVILVQSTTALCDGGGGATGHPVEYLRLDKREGASPVVCKYCGLRYKMAPGARACAALRTRARAAPSPRPSLTRTHAPPHARTPRRSADHH